MVLWESPGQEEMLMGASTLEGLGEVHLICTGLKCTGFIQGSRQSPCPGELAREAQIQGEGWDMPASVPGDGGVLVVSSEPFVASDEDLYRLLRMRGLMHWEG